MINEVDKLKAFEAFRKESIDLLDQSIYDKDSFLDANISYIMKLDLKPFTDIKTIDQAIYNYQYYNLLAKKANSEAIKIIHNPKKKKLYTRLINDRENYYYLKDKATINLLEIIDYKDVESYFIRLKSKRLMGEIFEIHIKSIDKAILHSKNKDILDKLRQNDCFDDECRPSIIDSYVNKSY